MPIDCDITPDVVVHLAAVSDQKAIDEDEAAAYATNVLGTLNVLEFCRNQQARLIFSSTAGVYQAVDERKLTENDRTDAATPFATEKRLCEDLCRMYASTFDVDTIILRLFNPYGPGQRSDCLVPYIIQNAVCDGSITLNHPESVRDFVHVDDIVTLIHECIGMPRGRCRIYNAGSGIPCRVSDVATHISTLMGKPITCYTATDAGDDPTPFLVADISNVTHDTDWRPSVNLLEGLQRMMLDVVSH